MLFGLSIGYSSPLLAEPGDHIGTGTVEIAPSVTVSTHHRNNVYLQEGELGGGQATTPGTALVVNPNIGVEWDDPNVLFRSGLAYTATQYLQSEVSNLNRYNDVDVSGHLDLVRRGLIGLSFQDRFKINGYESEAQKADDPYIQTIGNRGSGRFNIRPGPSLEISLGGDFSSTAYDTPNSGDYVRAGQNDRVAYGPGLEMKWHFLPKTAVVFEWESEQFDWSNNFVGSSGNLGQDVGDFLGVPDGSLMRTRGGLRGRVTQKLVLRMLAGYGTADYDELTVSSETTSDTEPESDISQGFGVDLGFPTGLLAEIDLEYTPRESQSVSIKYRRDFEDVFFTNFVVFNRFQVNYDGQFAGRYVLSASSTLRLENYQGEVTRQDIRLLNAVGLQYSATKYLVVNLGTRWRRRVSVAGEYPDIEYDDLDVHAGMTLTY